MADLKMPARRPEDGGVSVKRLDGDFIALDATWDGKPDSLVVSEYNAWRLFGMLSLILEIPLTRKASKAIQLGYPGKESSATFAPAKPLETLGDKVAWALAAEAAADKIREQGGIASTPLGRAKEAASKERAEEMPASHPAKETKL